MPRPPHRSPVGGGAVRLERYHSLGDRNRKWLRPTALLVALFSAAIPFSLEMFALPRMPRRTFAVFTSLEPAFGTLSGLVILHERLTPAQLCGVAGVIAAAAGAAWTSGGDKTPEVTDGPAA